MELLRLDARLKRAAMRETCSEAQRGRRPSARVAALIQTGWAGLWAPGEVGAQEADGQGPVWGQTHFGLGCESAEELMRV